MEDLDVFCLQIFDTGEHKGLKCCMGEVPWLSSACKCLNQRLPLLMVGENRTRRCSYSKNLMMKLSSICCLGEGGIKDCSCVLMICSEFFKTQNMQEGVNGSFLWFSGGG